DLHVAIAKDGLEIPVWNDGIELAALNVAQVMERHLIGAKEVGQNAGQWKWNLKIVVPQYGRVRNKRRQPHVDGLIRDAAGPHQLDEGATSGRHGECKLIRVEQRRLGVGVEDQNAVGAGSSIHAQGVETSTPDVSHLAGERIVAMVEQSPEKAVVT